MHKKTTRLIIFSCDLLALIVAFFISKIISQYISNEFFGNYSTGTLSEELITRSKYFTFICSMVLFVLYNRGHYIRRIPWWSQVRYLMITLFVALLLDGFMNFATKSDFSRLWITISWPLAFILIVLGRRLAKVIASVKSSWTIPTIIIGDKDNIIESIFALYSDNYTGYDITTLVINKGFEDFDKTLLPIPYQDIEVVNGANGHNKIIDNNKNSFFILAPDSFESFEVENIVNRLKDNQSRYAVVPPIEGLVLYGTQPQYFFGHDIMFLLPRDNIHSPLGAIIKRSIDIIISFIGLILLSPLFIILAVLVKKDGGPVFFSHARIGANNKKFQCWKFRSMAVNAEKALKELLESDAEARAIWETHRKLSNDPRITKVGRFIRKTSLDEFPQLWNVLRGDMSLVGPRPILPDEVTFFNKKELANYISVKPGITGLWQVSGRNDVSFKQRVYFDMWYVEKWSLWCDIVIMIKTFFIIVNRVGAR